MKACQRQRRYTLIGLLFGVAAVVYPASLASQILARTDVVPTAIPLLGVDSPPAASAELDSLLQILERFDSDRVDELAARYDQRGNAEKRRLEKRFGVIEHRFRVNADPRGIFQCWVAAGHGEAVLVDALKEITQGRYAAYYFFDGVIRPNVFASDRYLARQESAIHEKVHLIQPAVYRQLGLRCRWTNPLDPCVRSLEPVAVYLSEYAALNRRSPHLSDGSINRAIENYLVLEAERCR
ncbi:MAG: hypothetical protein KAI97_06610, partial [Gemmatimonadetes bacterium]|nr:hypothetical protein [Gemmatimonadota bacterium]